MPQKPSFGPELYEAGTAIIQQGELSDKFFIISRGRVEVVHIDDAGRETLVTTLQAGDYFGEVGIVTNSRRAATVRALTAVSLMAMDRATFADWLSSSTVVSHDIEETAKRRMLEERPLIMPAPSENEGSERRKLPTGFFETESLSHITMFTPGTTIVRQGEVADLFYIIVEGVVDVLRQRPDGSEVMVHQLGAGEYFGEVGLLTGERRIASVRASTGVKVISFDRDSFQAWLQSSPKSQGNVTQTALLRQQQTNKI